MRRCEDVVFLTGQGDAVGSGGPWSRGQCRSVPADDARSRADGLARTHTCESFEFLVAKDFVVRNSTAGRQNPSYGAFSALGLSCLGVVFEFVVAYHECAPGTLSGETERATPRRSFSPLGIDTIERPEYVQVGGRSSNGRVAERLGLGP